MKQLVAKLEKAITKINKRSNLFPKFFGYGFEDSI